MITFFSELSTPQLPQVFNDIVIEQLARHGAGVSLAILDCSPERAALIRKLQQRAIPVTAWLLLEQSEGYWLTADNAERAKQRYGQVRRWAQQERLSFAAVGLDIEVPWLDALQLMERGLRALGELLLRRRARAQLAAAQREYLSLVREIRDDGLAVESYQFPLVVDERRASSTLLQRALGFVDLEVDREVLMLYRTLLPRPLDSWLVESFGGEAQGVAVGITGGGVDFVDQATRSLTFDELAFDLQTAARHTDQLYVFSLEGCLQQSMLSELLTLDLGAGTPRAAAGPHLLRLLRRGLRLVLKGDAAMLKIRQGHLFSVNNKPGSDS